MRTFASILVALAPAAAIADTPKPVDATSGFGPSGFDVTELHVIGPSVEPTLVQRVLAESATAMSRCYDKVQTKPTGTVTLKLRIGEQGTVTSASATGVASMNACVTSAIKAIAFPPGGQADITEKLAVPIRSADILGAPHLQEGGAFASLTGTGDLSDDDANTYVYGGRFGNESGESGGFGFGRSPGGGTIGTSPRRQVARMTIGTMSASSDADKEAISARIQREASKIRACYEKELITTPNLAGKVIVKFRIEPTGKVSSATGSGLATVAACVARVISAVEFIKPNDGAIDVSYPFVFVSEEAAYSDGKTSAVANVSIGQPSMKGDLDKAIIRRYIKRNLQKILYCYEKELLARPKLAGTVTVSFQIEPDGKVSSATGTGLPMIDECVAHTIQSIEFPHPGGGGIVEVHYPFIFKPPGE